jgi:cytochrome P450 family 6/cytochrome P450 family 28
LIRFTKYVKDECQKDSNKAFDVRNICARYTVDVVSSCIFNADAQSFATEKPEIAEMGKRLVDFQGIFQFILFMLIATFPKIRKILKISMVDKEAENFFVNLMQQAIELRETNPIPREDFLSFLLELRNKKSISDIEMAAHGVTFFTDGTETSSLAIAHILYEVKSNIFIIFTFY